MNLNTPFRGAPQELLLLRCGICGSQSCPLVSTHWPALVCRCRGTWHDPATPPRPSVTVPQTLIDQTTSDGNSNQLPLVYMSPLPCHSDELSKRELVRMSENRIWIEQCCIRYPKGHKIRGYSHANLCSDVPHTPPMPQVPYVQSYCLSKQSQTPRQVQHDENSATPSQNAIKSVGADPISLVSSSCMSRSYVHTQ